MTPLLSSFPASSSFILLRRPYLTCSCSSSTMLVIESDSGTLKYVTLKRLSLSRIILLNFWPFVPFIFSILVHRVRAFTCPPIAFLNAKDSFCFPLGSPDFLKTTTECLVGSSIPLERVTATSGRFLVLNR
ncbi:hypothetical protein V6Z11_A07G142500 [Gossypium hirsutum]|uniref:Uncharacterized protein n=1 Tax=Gossypium darwinii TaxID=34276 RepID=A0A5D2FVE5_GOSDA|nr:hypothetical protein ES288_A07G143100v1 [Gossypium darwinii]